ncbi:MAG: TlpA family protein disulfide reductase [Kiritimatiellaeota bacterium]|nr:TlpA family protein disulfide reductase [Kiritimatiellota bacterium]
MKKTITLLSACAGLFAVATLLSSCGPGCNGALGVAGLFALGTQETRVIGRKADSAAAKPAPALAVAQWMQGPEVQVTTGQVTVVEFWATWCPPCRTSIPHINEIYKKHKDSGLAVVGLSNEKPEVVKPFIEKQGGSMTYPVAISSKADYANYMEAWGIGGIPHAFVVGADGGVAWHGHPMDSGFEAVIKRELDKIPRDVVE